MEQVDLAHLDLLTVRAFLERTLDAQVRDVQPVPYGHWCRTYAFATAAGPHVVRFTRWQQDLEKDRLVEARARAVVPLAQLERIGVAMGVSYAISRRVPGRHLDDLSTLALRGTRRSVLGLLESMRAVDLRGTSGYGCWTVDETAPHGSWPDYLMAVEADDLDDRLHGWRDNLSASTRGFGDFRLGLRSLERLLPEGERARELVHGDLWSRNVLVEESQVAGVVDWGWSLYGDGLYDVARLDFWAPAFPNLQAARLVDYVRAGMARSGVDTSDFDRRVLCYGLHVGLTAQKHAAFRKHARRLAWVTARTLRLVQRRRAAAAGTGSRGVPARRVSNAAPREDGSQPEVPRAVSRSQHTA